MPENPNFPIDSLVTGGVPGKCPSSPTSSSSKSTPTQTGTASEASGASSGEAAGADTPTAARQNADAGPSGDAASEPTGADLKRCIYAFKGMIDNAYYDYRILLHHVTDFGNAGLDIAGVGLTTGITATPVAAVKTVLGAIAAGVGGTKTIINEDLLYKQTIEILLNEMDADRNADFTIIQDQLNGSNNSNYTWAEAKDDLLKYYADGTWDHAITSLQTKTAANQAACEAQVNTNKVAAANGTIAVQSNGCNTQPAAAAPAATQPKLLAVPKTLVTSGGAGTLTIPLSSFPDDVLEVMISGLQVSQISGIAYPGADGLISTTVDLKKSDFPASGPSGSLIFTLKAIKPATTHFFVVSQLGKTSDGVPTGVIQSTTVAVSGN